MSYALPPQRALLLRWTAPPGVTRVSSASDRHGRSPQNQGAQSRPAGSGSASNGMSRCVAVTVTVTHDGGSNYFASDHLTVQPDDRTQRLSLESVEVGSSWHTPRSLSIWNPICLSCTPGRNQARLYKLVCTIIYQNEQVYDVCLCMYYYVLVCSSIHDFYILSV